MSAKLNNVHPSPPLVPLLSFHSPSSPPLPPGPVSPQARAPPSQKSFPRHSHWSSAPSCQTIPLKYCQWVQYLGLPCQDGDNSFSEQLLRNELQQKMPLLSREQPVVLPGRRPRAFSRRNGEEKAGSCVLVSCCCARRR